MITAAAKLLARATLPHSQHRLYVNVLRTTYLVGTKNRNIVSDDFQQNCPCRMLFGVFARKYLTPQLRLLYYLAMHKHREHLSRRKMEAYVT